MKRFFAILISLILLALPLTGLAWSEKKPVLFIETGLVTPEAVTGDEDIELKVTIRNYGEAEARFVRITAESDSESVALVSDLNGVFLEALPAGESTEVVFLFHTALHTRTGEYRLSVRAVYEDKNGMESSAEAAYRMNVVQEVSLSADMPEFPDPVVSGDSFTQSVFIYNPSDAPACNIHAELKVDGFIAGSAFVRSLAPGESAERELKVIVTELSGGSKYGKTDGRLTVTYEDENGNEKSFYISVTGNIEAPKLGPTPEEQAKLEEEEMKQNTLSKWWISALAAVAVIAILASVLIISRLARLVKIK